MQKLYVGLPVVVFDNGIQWVSLSNWRGHYLYKPALPLKEETPELHILGVGADVPCGCWVSFGCTPSMWHPVQAPP